MNTPYPTDPMCTDLARSDPFESMMTTLYRLLLTIDSWAIRAAEYIKSRRSY